ncbi:MAG TPA: Na-translocating system protein MpsC family protein [Thermoleophilaceae bacterium]|nr:Na-translocating system protein MpsC family protein [Thermoleophilaceae bacterium]
MEQQLSGGQLLAEISTTIVGILRDHYGRGPMKAKTYALDDIIVCVMRGSGFTPLEKTIMESGKPDRVVEMREDFQRVMADRYKNAIERLTGRKVLAFLSQAHVEPDITMEIFFVDAPLEGFGAVAITTPEDERTPLTSSE